MADKDQASTTAVAPPTSRGIIVLLVACAVLLLPPIFFGWSYLNRQVAYQTDRDVRALDAVGRQFVTAVTAYGKIVQTYAERDALNDFYKQVPQLSVDPSFQICFPDDAKVKRPSGNRPVLTYAAHDAEAMYLGYAPQKAAKAGDKKPLPLCVRAPFADLLANAKEERFFDGMFLSDATGTVLYQNEHSSVRLNRFGIEKPKSPAASDKGGGAKAAEAKTADANLLAAADQHELTRSGVTYKVFTRPVRLPLPLRHFGQTIPQPDVEWILGGFVQKDRFNRETRALPASLVSGVPFLLLLIVLAWPVLRLWSLDPRERVRWFDVHLLALCCALGAAWMTLGAVYVYARYQMGARVDDDLGTLSQMIERNLHADLQDAHRHLTTFIDAQAPWIDLALKEAEPETGAKTTGKAPQARRPSAAESERNPDRVKVLRDAPLAEDFSGRPYFDMLLWADAKGNQRVKWTILDANTPRINMAEVDVFRQTKSRALDAIRVSSPAPVPRFALQVFPSPITRKAIAVLARPVRSGSRLSEEGMRKFIYAAIVPHLRSVIDPVLPLDYGFAVIEPDGTVLLHSDSSRNTRENFYRESSTPLIVRSSVELAHADRFDMQYHGLDHRMLVTPLPNLDLSLVVFHDETMLDTLQAEMLSSSSVMLIACILLYLASAAVAFVLWRDEGSDWIWPDATRVGLYHRGVIVCTTLSALVAWFIFAKRGLPVVAASLLAAAVGEAFVFFQLGRGGGSWTRALLPLGVMAGAATLFAATVLATGSEIFVFAVVVAFVLLTLVLPHGGRRRSQRALVRGYCGLWVSVTVLVAVMPSLAIFADAYSHATETLVRAGQVQLAQELARRGEVIAKRYAPIASLQELVRPALDYQGDVYGESSLLGQREPYRVQDLPPVETDSPDRMAEAGWLRRWLAKDTCFDRKDDEECRLFLRHPAGLVSSFFPLYDDIAARLRRLAYESATDRRWSTALGEESEDQPLGSDISWSGDAGHTLDATARNVRYGYYTQGDEGDAWMMLRSQLPPLTLPHANLAWLLLGVCVALWVLLAARLIRWIGNALFGLEAWYEDGTSADESGQAEAPEPFVGQGRVARLRARMARAWQRWRGGAQVRLDRLLRDECGSSEPLRAIAKQIRQRPDATTLTREQILELIGDLAEPYYQSLWQRFGAKQKLVFVQLAQEGFVNPRNWDEVRAVNRKGLVRRAPAVRFVSEAFRRFVATIESPAQIAKWETAEVERAWGDTRTIAGSSLVIAAIALVLTRPDVFESWVGIATGVVGGVPVFMRLIGMVSSRGDAKKSEG